MDGGKKAQVPGVDKPVNNCAPHPQVGRRFFASLDAAMGCASIRRAIHCFRIKSGDKKEGFTMFIPD